MCESPMSHSARLTQGRKTRLGMIVGGLLVVLASLVIRYYWGTSPATAAPSTPAPAESSARKATTAASSSKAGSSERLEVMAKVNGKPITREALGRECLRHYGKEVLESISNKYLIAEECKQRGIVITQADVDAEVKRMAQRFNLPADQWLKLLKQERGINPAQYASDIIWPTLALRRLAGERLKVTPEELKKAYETQYGPSVDARLIACSTRKKAEEVHAKAVAKPDSFGRLAREFSEDAASASSDGMIQPLRKHGTYPAIEQAAFAMKDGDISPVIEAGGQFVILQRKRLLPGPKAVNFEQVAPQLEEMVRERKLRGVAHDTFATLQKGAKVENIINDPAKSQAMPAVAAIINGHKITIGELSEACLERHGIEVLEGTINRQLIEQECVRRNIQVTKQDVDAEIARAAAASMKPKSDGTPDVQGWLKLVTEEQGISEEVYRHAAVWPTVALKKLVGNNVKVTEEDLKKGFEANYGPRVRCLAIVLNNARRAQQVWDMARGNPKAEYFRDLAAEYSIESSSRALRGEVPPVKMHGGQPVLEKEAFALKAGELSSVIQVDDRFVILYCLGKTEPEKIEFAQVRDLIYEDIHEKKQRVAMAEYFDHLQDSATIDNYLAGTTRSPKKSSVPGEQVVRTAATERAAPARAGSASQANPSAGHAASPLRPAQIPTLRQVPAKR